LTPARTAPHSRNREQEESSVSAPLDKLRAHGDEVPFDKLRAHCTRCSSTWPLIRMRNAEVTVVESLADQLGQVCVDQAGEWQLAGT